MYYDYLTRVRGGHLRRHALRNRLLELGELPAVLAVAGVDDECQTGIVHL